MRRFFSAKGDCFDKREIFIEDENNFRRGGGDFGEKELILWGITANLLKSVDLLPWFEVDNKTLYHLYIQEIV